MLNEFLILDYIFSSFFSAECTQIQSNYATFETKRKAACMLWIDIDQLSHRDRIMHPIRTYPPKKPRLYVSAVSCTQKA